MNVSYIVFCFASLFIFGLIDNSRGPIYPEILNQFQIIKSSGSLIFSLPSLMSFLMALVSRFWLEKFGAIKATKISLIIISIAVFIMGVAAHNPDGFGVFIIASAIFGIGVGFLSIPLNMIIANVVPIENRQKVFSGLHSMYGMASLAAPSILSVVFYNQWSWQKYLLGLAVLPLIVFFVFFNLSSRGITPQEDNDDQKASKKTSIKLGILFAFYVSSEILVSSRLVIYCKEIWGMPLEEASSYLSVFFFLLLAGRLTFALVKINLPELRLLKISVSVTLILYLLGMYVHPLFLALTGGSMSYFFPTGMTWVSSKYEKSSDTLIATIMTYVGGMIVSTHWIVGSISDIYGLNISMLLGVVLLSVVLYFLQTAE
jgi:FHS family glucose/mannose:H+ symporter-like MFS transporter